MKISKKILFAVAVLLLILVSSTASASTLYVGNKAQYKTIQSAVDAAKIGDTIKVASGTYKENVRINKGVSILGVKYPKVDGFYYASAEHFSNGATTINGFLIQKNGITMSFTGGNGNIFSNNHFENCGIHIGGVMGTNLKIKNNKIRNGTIHLYDTSSRIITGNTISDSKCGIYVDCDSWMPILSKNTFKKCNVAIYLHTYSKHQEELDTTGNKFLKNKVNIDSGMDPVSKL